MDSEKQESFVLSKRNKSRSQRGFRDTGLVAALGRPRQEEVLVQPELLRY